MIHCAACGYRRDYHRVGTLACPVGPNEFAKTAKFKPPPPPDTALYPEIMRREARARSAAIEAARRPYEPVVVPPPLIPARAPRGPAEFAVSERGMGAAKLGRHAVAAGWQAEPWYWQTHDRAEGCAVRLRKGPLRAVALWSRKADDVGKLTGWKAEYAYAWRTDMPERFPVKINITDLERFLDDPEP